MKTAKIIVISGCVTGAVLFCGAVVMLYRGVVDFNKAKADLENSKGSLESYYNAKIFPSAENLKKISENARQADKWFDDLVKRLAAGNINSNDHSPSHFIAAGNKVRRDLIKAARKAGTELPDAKSNFAFGFERYTGADRALPKSADVPRLIEQLAIIKRISTILFNNGIKSISLVKRDVFETTANESMDDVAEEPSRPHRPHGRPGHRASSSGARHSSGSLADVGIIKGDNFFAKMHFVFEFRVKEKGLISILNTFSTEKMFIVVTSIEIKKQTPDLVPKVEIAPDKSDFEDDLFEDKPKKDKVVAKPRLGPDYPVCGVKMEIPMDVHLELDVYKFKEAKPDAGH